MLSILNRISATVTYVANSLPTGSEIHPGADCLQENSSENLYRNTRDQATGVSNDAENGFAGKKITSSEDEAESVRQLG